MFDDLLIHPKTKKKLQAVTTNHRLAVLLTGDNGAGKKTLAMSLAAHMLEVSVTALDYYPYFKHVIKSPKDKEISIDAIREVISQMKLAAPGDKPIKQIVLIENAHYMSVEAQNALLKLLEEPPASTLFILTALSNKSLLPTIPSRCQTINILPVSFHDAAEYFESENTREIIDKAWRLSGGNTGLMHSLLNENEEHPLKKAVDEAKIFLKGSRYKRLLMLDELAKDKAQLMIFLDAFERVIVSAHRISIETNKPSSSSARLARIRQLIIDSKTALEDNVNPKITITRIALFI